MEENKEQSQEIEDYIRSHAETYEGAIEAAKDYLKLKQSKKIDKSKIIKVKPLIIKEGSKPNK